MENFEIPDNLGYTEEIRKFEETDPAHADLFNAVVQTLVNNDAFIKRVSEEHMKNAENPHKVRWDLKMFPMYQLVIKHQLLYRHPPGRT